MDQVRARQQGTELQRNTAPEILIGYDEENDAWRALAGTDHVALLARTGTGKTTGFTIPNALNWPGSLVVLDIKGEIYAKTAGYRRDVLGQDVYCFNPMAHDGRSHRWNPLDIVDRTSLKRFNQIMRQAYLIVPDPPKDGNNNSVFWQPKARLGIMSVAWMLAEMPGQPFSYENIMHRFLRADGLEWLCEQIEARRGNPNLPPFSENVILGVSDYVGKGGRLTEDIRASITNNLQTFLLPEIAAATNASDFNLADLRRKPTTIYVTISPADIPRSEHILRLFFTSVMNLNTDLTPEQDPTLNVPLLMILDEFARLGVMTELTSAAQFSRGFGVRLAYVIQDRPQLEGMYGVSAAADVFNNVGAEIIFGLGDIRQAKLYEERMGNRTRAYDTHTANRFFRWLNWTSMHANEHYMARPLKYAQEIVMMPADEVIVLRPGMFPQLWKRRLYFNDPHFRGLSDYPPPEVPVLPIVVRPDDGSIKLPKLDGAQPPPPPPPNPNQLLMALAVPPPPPRPGRPPKPVLPI